MANNQMEYCGFILPYTNLARQLITDVKVMPVLTTDGSLPDSPVRFRALWDTGAMLTCASLKFRDTLKLRPVKLDDAPVLSGLTGDTSAELTIASIFPVDGMSIEHCPVYVADFDNDDFDMIIGMDIISMGDFAVCNADSKTSFSFVIPPFPDRIDFAGKAEIANKQSKM